VARSERGSEVKKKRIPLKPMSPSEVRTFDQICSLQRDNLNCRTGWILLNGANSVVITKQKPGEASTGSVEFTHAEFTRLAQWYLTPQKRVQRS
jgi:hypothetical protein